MTKKKKFVELLDLVPSIKSHSICLVLAFSMSKFLTNRYTITRQENMMEIQEHALLTHTSVSLSVALSCSLSVAPSFSQLAKWKRWKTCWTDNWCPSRNFNYVPCTERLISIELYLLVVDYSPICTWYAPGSVLRRIQINQPNTNTHTPNTNITNTPTCSWTFNFLDQVWIQMSCIVLCFCEMHWKWWWWW